MAYDRADWHYNGNYPSELPPEKGGTHIGMFLAWAITRDLIGDFHRENSTSSLEAVRRRTMTGREFFFAECDEKFWEEALNDEGNAFAKVYYEDDAGYLADYEAVLGAGLPTLYHVEDTWENLDKLAPTLDERLATWRARGAD